MSASKSTDSDRPRRSKSSQHSKSASSGRTRPDSEASPPRRTLEQRIDSPKTQTLAMLSCVAVLTVVLWSSAKLACNSKVASARPPLQLTTSELSTDPKNAAFELQQRWAMQDYSRVRSLAKGKVLAELDEAARRCAQDSSCEHERNELKARVKSTATLLTRSANAATVRVKTYGVEGGQQVYLFDMVQEDGQWKATSRRPDSAG